MDENDTPTFYRGEGKGKRGLVEIEVSGEVEDGDLAPVIPPMRGDFQMKWCDVRMGGHSKRLVSPSRPPAP